MVNQKSRFIVFFDGTANDPTSETNIHRLYQATLRGWHNGARQVPRYWEGVGVKPTEKSLGGIFAYGLQKKIAEAYEWLATTHRDGDEICIFGFSRGAFQAMGLAGLLAWRGLPKEASWKRDEWKSHLDLYFSAAQRDREHKIDGVRPLTELNVLPEDQRRALTGLDRDLVENFRLAHIEFLGVFDTVRAAGLEAAQWRGRNLPKEVPEDEHPDQPRSLVYRYTRHLPPIVKQGYQALAVNEERAAFHPRVWIIPRHNEPMPAGRTVEQRWFIGVHSNVGGGYKEGGKDDPLAFIPLHWMQTKAGGAGIQFDKPVVVPSQAHMAKIGKSFEEFSGSRLSWGRHCRPMLGVEPPTEEKHIAQRNKIKTEKQTVDRTVLQRFRDKTDYRPKNVTACLTMLPHVDMISGGSGDEGSVDEKLIMECKRLVAQRSE